MSGWLLNIVTILSRSCLFGLIFSEIGLIKGGDLNNAIVYVDKPLSKSNMEKLKIAFKKDKISLHDNLVLYMLKNNYLNEKKMPKYFLDKYVKLLLYCKNIKMHKKNIIYNYNR